MYRVEQASAYRIAKSSRAVWVASGGGERVPDQHKRRTYRCRPAAGAAGVRGTPWPLRSRRQCHCGFRRQQQEGERLLQVEAHGRVGMARIADRQILSDIEVEIAAARGHDKGPGDRRSPDDLAV